MFKQNKFIADNKKDKIVINLNAIPRDIRTGGPQIINVYENNVQTMK